LLSEARGIVPGLSVIPDLIRDPVASVGEPEDLFVDALKKTFIA